MIYKHSHHVSQNAWTHTCAFSTFSCPSISELVSCHCVYYVCRVCVYRYLCGTRWPPPIRNWNSRLATGSRREGQKRDINSEAQKREQSNGSGEKKTVNGCAWTKVSGFPWERSKWKYITSHWASCFGWYS